MRLFIYLIFLIPGVLYAKNEIIYCYELDKFSQIGDSDIIDYYEIDEKDKKLKAFKQYYDVLSDSNFYHVGDADWEFNDFDNPENIIEIFKFDENHISYKLNYLGYNHREDIEQRFIHFRELDRISGIMILKYGILLNENNEMFTYGSYTNNTEDIKYFKKDDERKFWNNVIKQKYQCEKSKNL